MYVTVKFKYSQSVCDLNKFFGNNCTEVQQSFVLYFQYDFFKLSFWMKGIDLSKTSVTDLIIYLFSDNLPISKGKCMYVVDM